MDRFDDAAARLAALADAQHNRLLTMTFPHNDGPADACMLVNRITVHEAMSMDFRIEVEVLSDNAHIGLKSILGKMVTVSLVREDGSLRHFNGYATEFSLIKTDGGFAYYGLVLSPWMHFLSLRVNCRVFHRYSVLALTEATFADYFERDWRSCLSGDYDTVTLSNQYNETDHNHLHRRWEEHGIHYWYEHRADGHTLCLGDSSDLAPPIDAVAVAGAPQEIPFRRESGSGEDDGIHQWRAIRRMAPARTTLGTFNFKSPRAQHASYRSPHDQGDDVAEIESFAYTGAYGHKDHRDGERRAQYRMEAHEAAAQHFEAHGNDRAVQPGRLFKLGGHFSADAPSSPDTAGREYLILSAIHEASNNYHAGPQAASNYTNCLVCQKASKPWRPAPGHNSSTPLIAGVQTATVVGPEGAEIHTDEYGRIKVQFHWDRLGKLDDSSSPWVRVMTSWAGSGFGQISLPRVGQEVVLQFLDGNVDRPLVVGSVYNANNMPPWDLPANKAQSGILTRSTREGRAGMANALRFDDEAGKEQLWLHAERDQLAEVEHDEVKWVGNDRRKTVDHDEVVEVKHDRTETVGNDEKITVQNDRTERVGRDERIDVGHDRAESVGNNEQIQIAGNRAVEIGGSKSETVMRTKSETIALAKTLTVGGAYAITVGAAMHTLVTLSQFAEVLRNKVLRVGKKLHAQAGEECLIAVGGATIQMRNDGSILIYGKKIDITATDGDVTINGKKVWLNPVGGGTSLPSSPIPPDPIKES